MPAIEPAVHCNSSRDELQWQVDDYLQAGSKRLGGRSASLIRNPTFPPLVTCAASISPRFTRCKTVCLVTPRARVASCMVMNPSPADAAKRALRSSVMRIRHGAPGVTCSPAIRPSLSQMQGRGRKVQGDRRHRDCHDVALRDLRLRLKAGNLPV